MARQAIQNSNASLYIAGSGSVSIASNASTLPIGDSTHRVYTWGGKFRIGPNTPTPTSTFFTKASAKYPFQFRVETGKRVRVAVYDGSANPTIVSTKGVVDNGWHTLIGVRDDNTISFYIDGVLVGTNTTTLAAMNEASSISMASNGFIGNVSDAFFTFNAFTATDALNYHLNGTIPYTCLFRLPLSEGAGSIAYDTSGNGNNGTITSGTWSKDAPSKTRTNVNGNMVYNGDFEIAPVVNVATTTTGRWLDGTAGGSSSNNTFGWALDNVSYAGSSAMFDTSVFYSGSGSLKLSTTTTGVFTDVTQATTRSIANLILYGIRVLPSTSYTMTFRMKTNYVSGDSNGARMMVEEFSGDGTAGATSTTSYVKTTTDWTSYSLTFTTASTCRFVLPRPQIRGDLATATLIMDAWFDDIKLYPTTAITRSAATGRSTAGTRLSA